MLYHAAILVSALLMVICHCVKLPVKVPMPDDNLFGTVYCTPAAQCVYGAPPGAAYLPAAQVAVNNDGEPVNGWDVVVVRAVMGNPTMRLSTQYYAMGYAEGFVTNQRIYQTYLNQQIKGQRANFSSYVSDWINNHVAYMRNESQQPQQDAYWAEVGLTLRQIDGLTDGFNDASAIYNVHLEFMDIFLISFLFEIGDVVQAMHRLHGNGSQMTESQKLFYKGFTSHCSALIKPVPAAGTANGVRGDLLVTHSTWGTLESMLRPAAQYRFQTFPLVRHM